MALSKKNINALVIERNSGLFRCPVCASTMELMEKARLVCVRNHSFDLSKQGYVNLAPQAHSTKYDQSLFKARKTVIDSGFFNPLLETITNTIQSHVTNGESSTIIDAGCGEGSHLTSILSQLGDSFTGVGIDLAKEGVLAAAKEHPGAIWLVADLANCPFQDKQFDVLVNILSPANYAEFSRILKPNGVFIKVVPEVNYLKELREVFYEKVNDAEETDRVERISNQFEVIKTERITYDFPITNELLATLIHMTPLTWGASADKISQALEKGITSISVDFNMIICKRGVLRCLAE